MPTNAFTAGAVQFPIDATAKDTPLRDPVTTALLHMAAHWLNFGMGAKLNNMQPTKSLAVPQNSDGVPINLGEFDPGTTFVRRPLPALYCWWVRSKEEQFTQVKWLRTSEYHMRYYFKPLTVPKGRGARSGVMSGADRLLHRMSDLKRHRTFPPTAVQTELTKVGVTVPLNGSLEVALNLRELKIIRSVHGMTWEEPGQQTAGETISRNLGGGADGGVQKGFPTLHCVWSVKEFLDEDQVSGPVDETPDLDLLIRATTGEGEGHVDIMTRNLQAPDGATLEQKDDFDDC